MSDKPADEREYTLSEMNEDGVDDEAANESEETVQFTISSYGADYTVDSLVKRLNDGAFFVPPFQRSYVWTQRQASRFIESLLLGLPIPGIFVAKEKDSAKHLIIDGQQRLKTLQFFFLGTFREKTFRLLDVDKRWNERTVHELEADDKQRLDDATIHTTVFKQDFPVKDDLSIYYVFERLNSGGSKLYPQEIRNCVSYGPFIEFLSNLNKNPTWRDIYGPVNPRLKDQELILRFLALHEESDTYTRPMKDFLNKFTEKHRRIQVSNAEKFKRLFEETLIAVSDALGSKSAFRPERNLNAAVFDSVMSGLAKRIERGPIANKTEIKVCYDKLLTDPKFQASYQTSTATEANVKERLKLAREAFARIA